MLCLFSFYTSAPSSLPFEVDPLDISEVKVVGRGVNKGEEEANEGEVLLSLAIFLLLLLLHILYFPLVLFCSS